MKHPSIHGLREAVAEGLRKRFREFENRHGEALPMPTAIVALEVAAAYLTEHGVLLSGEGLVRARVDVFDHVTDKPINYLLVPVPQDGE